MTSPTTEPSKHDYRRARGVSPLQPSDPLPEEMGLVDWLEGEDDDYSPRELRRRQFAQKVARVLSPEAKWQLKSLNVSHTSIAGHVMIVGQ